MLIAPCYYKPILRAAREKMEFINAEYNNEESSHNLLNIDASPSLIICTIMLGHL